MRSIPLLLFAVGLGAFGVMCAAEPGAAVVCCAGFFLAWRTGRQFK